MDDPYHYRNKAQYPIGRDKEGKTIAGFFAGRTHDIIPNTDCVIGAAENKQILEVILGFINRKGISVYDEKTGKGLVRHVLIRGAYGLPGNQRKRSAGARGFGRGSYRDSRDDKHFS